MTKIRTKTIEVNTYDACVVRYALVQRLKAVVGELQLLRLARERDLDRVERWQLPANLQQLSQQELAEQVDPWISLRDTIARLIKEYDV